MILYASVILQTLQDAVKVSVANCSNPTLPIKFVALGFTVPNDQKYLEIIHIPTDEPKQYLGDEKLYQGAMRLILHWPNNSAGPYSPMELLEEIVGHFDKGLRLQKVEIYDNPTIAGVLEQGAELLFSATVRYRSYRA